MLRSYAIGQSLDQMMWVAWQFFDMQLFVTTSTLFLIFIGAASTGQSNIVLIVTDDQDVTLGGMNPMVKTLKNIADEGASMMNAFTTSPICCPSRASILTGLYQKNTKVFNNTLEGGCSNRLWQESLEKDTFAVALKKANYSTFYGGKYLNKYGQKSVGGPEHIPPGWDSWVGLVGNSRYYNYTLSVNGTAKRYKDEYLTSILSSFAVDFLEAQSTNQNQFLMVLAPPAPHAPFTPEPKYKGKFKEKKVPREPHFNTANNTDKHWLVRMKPAPLPNSTVNLLDKFYASRWETLLSVDDLVEVVIEKLRQLGLLSNTYIIFTSDNGFHMGQFSLPWDKRQPYEFDIRVPFLMRGPGIPKKSMSLKPVILLDIFPTLLQIAGLETTSTDGQSILPYTPSGNRTFFLEYKGEGSNKYDTDCPWKDNHLALCSLEACCKCQDSRNNTYTCVRSIIENVDDFVYCRFEDGEEWVEAYDLNKDPYQLVNLDTDLELNKIEQFKKLLDSWSQHEV